MIFTGQGRVSVQRNSKKYLSVEIVKDISVIVCAFETLVSYACLMLTLREAARNPRARLTASLPNIT
jgi:hypothetical protein